MKKIFMLLMACGFSAVAFGQGHPTQAVNSTFSQQFPKASEVSWTVSDNMYEASFQLDGKAMTADYRKNGMWLQKAWPVQKSDMPKVIREEMNDPYAAYTIQSIQEMEKWDGQYFYQISAVKEGKTYQLLFEKTGNLVSTQKI